MCIKCGRKTITTSEILALIGWAMAIVIFIFNLVIYKNPKVLGFPDFDKSEDFQGERTRLFGWIFWIAGISFIFHSFGLSRRIWAQTIFEIGAIISAICYIGTVVYLTKSGNQNWYRDALSIKAWLFVRNLNPEYVKSFQYENNCCGWYNVFDHCTHDNRLEIMMLAIEKQALEDFQDMMNTAESDLSIESFSSSLSSSQGDSIFEYGENDYTDLYGSAMAAAENLTVCDKNFPVEQLFYFDMPCRQDEIAIQLFGPDAPPRTVGQSCPKYEHETEHFCHFNGCSELIFAKLGVIVEQVKWICLALAVIYFLLIIKVGYDLCCSSTSSGIYKSGQSTTLL